MYGIYLIEHASVVIVWIIACNCPNYTIFKALMYFTASILFLFTREKYIVLISYSYYRGIQLIGHTMKLWERIIETRPRRDLTFSNQQYGFMAGKSTTHALFALRVLMEKYREGQKELHCVFVDLE